MLELILILIVHNVSQVSFAFKIRRQCRHWDIKVIVQQYNKSNNKHYAIDPIIFWWVTASNFKVFQYLHTDFVWTLSCSSFPSSLTQSLDNTTNNVLVRWVGGCGIRNLLLNFDLWKNFILSTTLMFPFCRHFSYFLTRPIINTVQNFSCVLIRLWSLVLALRVLVLD